MSLRVKIGSFAQGTTSVTGLGFRPAFVWLAGNRLTADGTGAHATLSLGGAASAANRRAYAGDYQDAVSGTTRAYRGAAADASLLLLDAVGQTTLAKADVTSFDADGFTLAWATDDAAGRVVNYIAVGGTDVQACGYAGVNEPGTGGPTTQAHGWGFAPDVVWHYASQNNSTAPPTVSAASWFARLGFWHRLAGGTPHEQAALTTNFQNASAAFNGARWSRSGKQHGVISGNAFFRDAVLDSVDASNLTVTTQAVGGTTVLGAADFGDKGVRAKVGTFACATATGLQTVSGVGFEPVLVVVASVGEPLRTDNTFALDNRLSFGAATRARDRFALWLGSTHGGESGSSKAQQALDRASLVRHYAAGGSAPTLLAAADLDGMTGDGFRLNWGTADGAARDCFYLALGQQAGRRGALAHVAF
jgi:hypothetical protein